VLLALIIWMGCAGCAADRGEDRWSLTERFTPPHTPVFMNGPMALLLTNHDAFSCHAVVEMGGTVSQAGELFGRSGRLLFALQPDATTGKRLRQGGFSFLWNVREAKGYVMSDPLQGAAPLTATQQYTNVLARALPGGAEKIEGFLCEQESVVIAAADGTSSIFQIWRARDAANFPVKIRSEQGGAPLTVTFSKVRFEAPPAGDFRSPDGFTKYASLESLVNEYVARQQQLRGGRRTLSPDYGDTLGITPR
jgi:hypothetical protein